ncbi:Dps family protein [[Mycoplasma] gypis]|uniref:DNA starvation/stationary phase protection protein n=1 Tax=[Mycoplasma] gypis TaxID=92404 RepID=A0ABZ2RML5_9BACT|nr:DNA starvation/stationary phase protection protein [[Mycoplasma] gypis]MBN0919065.1 DNA starvation/stationary phase protection protein [[Mycoplasma] gypis]
MNNIKDLKTLQASLMFLQVKVKNYHWNVKGFDFFETHETLDKFYDDTVEQLDALAEKIVMLDDIALGNVQESFSLSFIKEDKSATYETQYIYKNLVSDLNHILDFVSKMENISFRVQPLLDELVIYADTWQWKFKKSTM